MISAISVQDRLKNQAMDLITYYTFVLRILYKYRVLLLCKFLV